MLKATGKPAQLVVKVLKHSLKKSASHRIGLSETDYKSFGCKFNYRRIFSKEFDEVFWKDTDVPVELSFPPSFVLEVLRQDGNDVTNT